MSKRIRRHVDPSQCRVAITAEDWLQAYRSHGGGEIWLDLGCGKGEFLAGLAALNPAIFFIGVEVRRAIAEKYFHQYKDLPNLLLFHGNVNLSIPSMMDGRKVRRVFIHFPDPYGGKPRYRKRRMVNENLVEGLCTILAPGGTASVKTDDQALFEEMDALLSDRLEPLPIPAAPPGSEPVLTEWEKECLSKSIPVYAREYRLKPSRLLRDIV
jgi:tRNA (guanine-N7-)-methyltransferase